MKSTSSRISGHRQLPPAARWRQKSNQPTIKQYAAVVWDHDRKNVYAIAFTPLVFVNPPGVVAPRPYPLQYVYPSLEAVNTSSYRHFHPEPFGAGAIQFDTHHTHVPVRGRSHGEILPGQSDGRRVAPSHGAGSTCWVRAGRSRRIRWWWNELT